MSFNIWGKSSSSYDSLDLADKIQEIEVIAKFPHDPSAFYPGLLFAGKDTLYESTGLYGERGKWLSKEEGDKISSIASAAAPSPHMPGIENIPATLSHGVRRYVALMVSSILTITWLNLSNDVYDFDTGADKNKRNRWFIWLEGKPRRYLSRCNHIARDRCFWYSMDIFDSKKHPRNAIARLGYNLRLCIPVSPFRLSYKGLGEPLCFTGKYKPPIMAIGKFAYGIVRIIHMQHWSFWR